MASLTTLHWTLGASVLLHGALLTVRLVDPEAFNRVFEDQPLEVILVNASTKNAPTKAQAIAQAHIAGGGEQETGRASSPLPPSAMTQWANDSEDDQRQQIENLQQQQQRLLTQVKAQIAALSQPINPQANQQDQVEREERRKQLIKLLAEIERRINMENARPKRQFIGPSVQQAVYALYYDRLRRAIETKGTDNFPTQNGQKIYGDLTMIVTINHNGKVLDTEVVQSSGNKALDRQAQAIAHEAGPFGRFSSEMRRQAEQLAVVAHFNFTRDSALQATVSSSGQ
ncbi:TonB family protein [Curvibacter sp. CHRR-16]|uniref:energy transducer TonB n=1 Tax=Curvibacter sp. CHRR-16 TaxID=2835872 RepID=UPI001BDA392A|nr:TonB family protein [Curvibacter sp. CHRR-16]MBT0569954.1 TonB family protein [Curvibacter sp. CHRR-16]